jgi:hypoxanthine phosphoribosyltransferase
MSELRLSGDENFIPSAEITERTADLAHFYDLLYGNDEVIVISVLHGAVRFAQNLTGAMRNPNVIEDSVRVSSMRGTEHVEPTLLKDTDVHIKGLNVLVVEDIDDTRSTLNFLLPRLRDRSPKRLDLVSLLNKPTAEKIVDELDADSTNYGFSIVDEFVVGHGLDWKQISTGKQYWRSLNHISLAVNVGGEAEEDQFWVPEVMSEDQELSRASLRLIR